MSFSSTRGAAVAAILLLLSSLGLAACNTVEGVGEDVQAGGRAVENAAKDAKR